MLRICLNCINVNKFRIVNKGKCVRPAQDDPKSQNHFAFIGSGLWFVTEFKINKLREETLPLYMCICLEIVYLHKVSLTGVDWQLYLQSQLLRIILSG